MAAVDVSRLESELKELQKKRGDVEYRLRSIENKEKAQQGLLGKRGRGDSTNQHQAKRFREVRSDSRGETVRRDEGRSRDEPRSFRGANERDHREDARPSRLSSVVTGQRQAPRELHGSRSREEPKKPKLTSAIVSSNPIPVVGEKPRPSLDTTSEETKKRSRNMFGMLVSTLKSFKSEITQKTEADQRRDELEQKIQQKVKDEQETFKEEQRRQLQEQKDKELALREEIKQQQEQKELELLNLKWDSHRSLLSVYTKTTAQPPIYWKPAKADQDSESKSYEKLASENPSQGEDKEKGTDQQHGETRESEEK